MLEQVARIKQASLYALLQHHPRGQQKPPYCLQEVYDIFSLWSIPQFGWACPLIQGWGGLISIRSELTNARGNASSLKTGLHSRLRSQALRFPGSTIHSPSSSRKQGLGFPGSTIDSTSSNRLAHCQIPHTLSLHLRSLGHKKDVAHLKIKCFQTD